MLCSIKALLHGSKWFSSAQRYRRPSDRPETADMNEEKSSKLASGALEAVAESVNNVLTILSPVCNGAHY